jgi:phage baseplate assembly protein W
MNNARPNTRIAAPDPAKAFLGVGWAFPVSLEPDGQIAMASYEDDVAQAIRIILGTNPGERLMRPDFGAGLNAFVFEPLNTTTIEMLKKQVGDALVDWEPRIDVQQLSVTMDPDQRNKLALNITYRVRASNSLSNLVYPFFFQEGKPA